MKKRRSYMAIIVCSVVMLILILDNKTALVGATEALSLCITTVIPSLFPMMVLSSILTDQIAASTRLSLGPLNQVLGIPSGSEGILAAGLLGGYPVGAACIASRYRSGDLSQQDAEHLLSFCSNAGPSFIFGICGHLFTKSYAVWLLWLIHVVSALMTGITRLNAPADTSHRNTPARTILDVVKNATGNMAVICGWIVLFRVTIQFCQKWLLWFVPASISVGISGILELTNGCCMLDQITGEPMRFVLCSVLLSFGGFCVLMQTSAVISPLSITPYLYGKLRQALYSLLLSSLAGFVLYSTYEVHIKLLLITLILIAPPFLLYFIKKTIAFSGRMRYNTVELCRKR